MFWLRALTRVLVARFDTCFVRVLARVLVHVLTHVTGARFDTCFGARFDTRVLVRVLTHALCVFCARFDTCSFASVF